MTMRRLVFLSRSVILGASRSVSRFVEQERKAFPLSLNLPQSAPVQLAHALVVVSVARERAPRVKQGGHRLLFALFPSFCHPVDDAAVSLSALLLPFLLAHHGADAFIKVFVFPHWHTLPVYQKPAEKIKDGGEVDEPEECLVFRHTNIVLHLSSA